ncbi:MAG: aromatic ring-hydroxylating dioxygenase subunit alpha [Deltaproteobacteria bacterium]|jgi:phenylpropionate dioxygenase-like ring-hydroxylating dioxygenase large terminal subunit|nr:aromatic ring-hydroxylating dioxygenase subunit alpha [Deltaproteobacteria bacterium]
MERKVELECIRRFLAHLRDGTTDLAPAPLRLPVSHYIDPEHLERERRHVFRGAPKLIALSGDLRERGSYLPLDVAGVPILLMRHDDDRVRAFVNGCRHRGSPIASEPGCAKGGHLQCPFHAWTYSTDGHLARIPMAAEAFRSLEPDRLGLHERPCLESEGLIFVRAEGDAAIGENEALAGIRDDMRALGLGTYHAFQTRTARWRCNWKLVLDTFLESYHVFSLHRETVHPWYFSLPMVYDGWGSNIRFPVARRTLAELEGEPEESWRLADHATVQWLVGSNSLISHTRDYLLLWHFTSPEPGLCDVRTTFYSSTPVGTPEERERLDKAFDLQLRVTGAEDFPMQEEIQSVIASGAIPELVYGANEVATIHFHRALQEIIDAGEARR